MMNDSTRSRTVLRALLVFAALGALAAVLTPTGSADPSTKNYDAFVVPAGPPSDGTASLKLTLTNESNSQQTLGSANFTAPSGWTVQTFSGSTTSTDGFDWNVCSGDGTTCGAGDNVVQFRAATNGDALTPGASVSYTVTTNVVCPASPKASNSTWTTEAKQQNDFSGQPGNDFSRRLSDLEPLGGFSFANIGTQTTGTPFDVTITAYDTCGVIKEDYNGAGAYSGSLSTSSPYLAVEGAVSWSGGVGTDTVTGTIAETGDTLTWSDANANISASSNSFDVMDTLCSGEACHAQDKTNNPNVTADSNVPNGAQLGLGFNSHLSSDFSCNGGDGTAGNTAILLVDPLQGYLPGTIYDVTVTWSKAVSGGGPPSGFAICIGKPQTDGTYTWTLLDACTSADDHPCIASEKRVSGGALQAVLQLDPSDPGFGGR